VSPLPLPLALPLVALVGPPPLPSLRSSGWGVWNARGSYEAAAALAAVVVEEEEEGGGPGSGSGSSAAPLPAFIEAISTRLQSLARRRALAIGGRQTKKRKDNWQVAHNPSPHRTSNSYPRCHAERTNKPREHICMHACSTTSFDDSGRPGTPNAERNQPIRDRYFFSIYKLAPAKARSCTQLDTMFVLSIKVCNECTARPPLAHDDQAPSTEVSAALDNRLGGHDSEKPWLVPVYRVEPERGAPFE